MQSSFGVPPGGAAAIAGPVPGVLKGPVGWHRHRPTVTTVAMFWHGRQTSANNSTRISEQNVTIQSRTDVCRGLLQERYEVQSAELSTVPWRCMVDEGPTPYILDGGGRTCSQHPNGQLHHLQKQWRRENYCTYSELKSARPLHIVSTALTELLRRPSPFRYSREWFLYSYN